MNENTGSPEAWKTIPDTDRQPTPRTVWFVLLLVAVVAATLYFWRLGFAMTEVDEATHAMVVREMRERGDVWTLHYLGENYFRKPPLAFWLRALAETAFGETEFALRFFSALAGVVTALMLAWWTWLLTRKYHAALIAGLLFPLLPFTHIHTFRNGTTDGVFLALLTVAAFFFWRSLSHPRSLLLASAALGFSFLTKSAAVVPLVVAAALTLLLLRRWPYSLGQLLGALGVFFAVTLPWHIQQYVEHRAAFVDEYLKYHILQRTTDAVTASSKTRGILWYFKAAEKGMYPWIWILFPAAAFALSRIWKKLRDHPAELFLILWGGTTFLLYSLARTKLDWYIAPAYIPWTMLIAMFLARPFDRLPRWLQMLAGGTFLVFLVRAAYLARIGVKAAYPFTTVVGLRTATVLLLALGIVLLLISVVVAKRARLPVSRLLAIAAIVPFLIAGTQTWIEYERSFGVESPLRVFRQAINARDPAANVVIVEPEFGKRPAVRWYLSDRVTDPRLIAINGDVSRLPQLLQDHPGSFVVARKDRELAPDVAGQLQITTTFRDLALYRTAQ